MYMKNGIKRGAELLILPTRCGCLLEQTGSPVNHEVFRMDCVRSVHDQLVFVKVPSIGGLDDTDLESES